MKKNIKNMYEEYTANFYGAYETPATYSPRITEAVKSAKTEYGKPVCTSLAVVTYVVVLKRVRE